MWSCEERVLSFRDARDELSQARRRSCKICGAAAARRRCAEAVRSSARPREPSARDRGTIGCRGDTTEAYPALRRGSRSGAFPRAVWRSPMRRRRARPHCDRDAGASRARDQFPRHRRVCGFHRAEPLWPRPSLRRDRRVRRSAASTAPERRSLAVRFLSPADKSAGSLLRSEKRTASLVFRGFAPNPKTAVLLAPLGLAITGRTCAERH
jgi:hypothetical protein